MKMCLSINKLAEISKFLIPQQNVGENVAEKEVEISDEKIYISDMMALATQQMRKLFRSLVVGVRRVEKSVFYKIFTRTTQPAHATAVLIVLFISFFLWPEFHHQGQHKRSVMTAFIYLGSFATHLGAQIWMTFVSGLALYFSLPRHTFGKCQEILFPKYFFLNTVLSSATLVTFAKMDSRVNDLRWTLQIIVLSLCVIVNMTIYLYLTPSLLKFMAAKYQFERNLGNGQEVGYQETVDGLKSKTYQDINKKFRKAHMKCAIGNIVTICFTSMHLYYLASKVIMF